MAQDIFIKFYGIDGESLDLIHKKEIEVLSWRWAVGQTSNMHSGSGGGAGKSIVHDLQLSTILINPVQISYSIALQENIFLKLY